VEPVSYLSKEVAMALEPEEQADEVSQVVEIIFPSMTGAILLPILVRGPQQSCV